MTLSYEDLIAERQQILIALERVVAYDGLLDVSPVALLVSELVRDHGELESRIEAALVYASEAEPTQELQWIVHLLRGAPRVPDTVAEIDGFN